MISTNHQNAEYYFDRDVECVRTFFRRRFGFVVERVPTLRSHVVRSETLDVELAASGWTQLMADDFEKLALEVADAEATLGIAGDDEDNKDENDNDRVGGRTECLQETKEEETYSAQVPSTTLAQLSMSSPRSMLSDRVAVMTNAQASGSGVDASGSLAAAEAGGSTTGATKPSMQMLKAEPALLPMNSFSEVAAGKVLPGLSQWRGDANPDPCSEAVSRISRISQKPLHHHADIVDRVKRDLLKKNANKNHAGGNPKRNEHKDRDKRKLATATKHEASGFSNW